MKQNDRQTKRKQTFGKKILAFTRTRADAYTSCSLDQYEDTLEEVLTYVWYLKHKQKHDSTQIV